MFWRFLLSLPISLVMRFFSRKLERKKINRDSTNLKGLLNKLGHGNERTVEIDSSKAFDEPSGFVLNMSF